MLRKNRNELFLFFSFIIIYYIGSFSKVPFGDCIGFVLETERSKFILSTSTYNHFIFNNTLIFLKKIFPLIDSPDIARLVIISFSAFCIVILYKIVLQVTRNKFYSVFGSVLFGLSFSFWKNAEIVEVYTYNLFFVALFLRFAIQFLLAKDKNSLLFASLFLSLSFWVHIQNILMIPAWIFLIYNQKNISNSIKSISIFSFIFLGLIAVPFFSNEPISSVFSSGVVIKNLQLSTFLMSFGKSIAYLVYNFWYFIVFIVFGCIYLFQNHKQIFFFLSIAALPIFMFATTFEVSDNYVFFIPFNFIFAIVSALGCFYLNNKIWLKKVCYTVVLVPVFYLLSFKIISVTEKGKEFDKSKAYKGGLSYFLLPWMHDNVGIVEFTKDKRTAPESIIWMTELAEQYIAILKSKNYTKEEISSQ